MKKLIYILSAILLTAGLLVSCGDSPGGGGPFGDDDDDDGDLLPWDGVTVDTDWFSGSENSFDINTPEKLAGLAKLVNDGNDFRNKNITQTANLDLAGEEWTPIGTDSKLFNGAYNGNGKTITGLTIASTADNQGLFGVTGRNGTVKGVTLKDVSITGGDYVGAVVGSSFGEVADCAVSGSVSGVDYVGGVVGRNSDGFSSGIYGAARMSGCSFTIGSVTGVGYVGGIVGYSDGGNAVVSNCSFKGSSVTGTDNYVGGVVGYSIGINATVSNCSFSGAGVTGAGYVGGVVGGTNRGGVGNCSASGAVTGSGDYVGGVVGQNAGINTLVDGCSYFGISVKGANHIGGIAGGNSAAWVKNCSASNGSVTGTGNYVGGIVGRNYGAYAEVSNCSFTGASVTGVDYVGGVVGGADDSPNRATIVVKLCSATSSITGVDWVGGVVGISYSNLESLTFSGSSVKGANRVGGIVGSSSASTVKNCSVTGGSVTGTGKYIGGVVGQSAGTNATVSGCSFTGSSVTGSDDYVGGVVGGNDDLPSALVELCSATGSITGVDYVGGVVGVNYSNVDSCTFSGGNVKGVNEVGGVVGRNSGANAKVSSCYSKGSSVTCTGNYAGGVVGWSNGLSSTNAIIENCYETSAVEASSATGAAGGIAGFQGSLGTLQYCYATGSVKGNTAGGTAGGIIGSNSGSVRNSVALNATITGGTGTSFRVGDDTGTGTYVGNYANNQMTVNGVRVTGIGTKTNGHGESVDAGILTVNSYNNFSFWDKDYAGQGPAGWDLGTPSVPGVWAWAGSGAGTTPGTSALPVLAWEVE